MKKIDNKIFFFLEIQALNMTKNKTVGGRNKL